MSSIQDKIYALQQAYPLFLDDFVTKRAPLCENQSVAARLFSKKLKDAVRDPTLGSRAPILYIQKRWTLLCREISQPKDKLSDKFVKRIEQIKKKLTELSDEILKEVPNEISNAESIFDLLSQPIVEQALKEFWDMDEMNPALSSTGVNYHFRRFPEAMSQTKGMILRILNGTYGLQLARNLRDQTKNPLLLADCFKRMLFIDLYINPKKHCEWFSDCEPQDIDSIFKALDALRSTLRDDFSLSEGEILALLMHKSYYLPDEMKERFNKIFTDCDYSRARHNVVLESILAYMEPSMRQLNKIASAIAPENPIRALDIACRIADEEVQANSIKRIITTAKNLDLTFAQKLREELESSKPQLYQECLEGCFKAKISFAGQDESKAYDGCVAILQEIKDPDEYQLGLSSLFFWMLRYEHLFEKHDKLIELNATLTDQKLRFNVFDRWVEYVKKTPFTQEEIFAKLQRVVPFITDEKEKLYLLKTKMQLLKNYAAKSPSESTLGRRSQIALRRLSRKIDLPQSQPESVLRPMRPNRPIPRMFNIEV